MASHAELDRVKLNIRCVMSVCRDDMSYESLLREYEKLVYEPMSLCGFGTCVELMNSIPDVIQVIPGKPNILRLVPSPKSQHVVSQVKRQKPTMPKSFPSASRLASLGIVMPERDYTKVRKQSSYKPKVPARPLTPENWPDNWPYKWPPASELWKACKEDQRRRCLDGPAAYHPTDNRPSIVAKTEAKNDGSQKQQSGPRYFVPKIIQNENSPQQNRSYRSNSQGRFGPRFFIPIVAKNDNSPDKQSTSSSTSNDEHPVKSNDQCDPNVPSHAVQELLSTEFNIYDSNQSPSNLRLIRKIFDKIKLEPEILDLFFTDL